MKRKKVLKEVIILRSIACLCVVLLHSVSRAEAYGYLENLNENTLEIVLAIRLLLTFGTPTFIFLSELTLAYAYKNVVPEGFLWKRFKFIMIPFILMSIFYAVFSNMSTVNKIPANIVNNLLGGYHGYFILVIFQFYFLHIVFSKYINKFKPKGVLIVCFCINVIYLGIFNLINPYNSKFGNYFWEQGYFLLFLGWIFYFCLAYYCGLYYENFLYFIKKQWKLISISPILLGAIVIILDKYSFIPSTSKRFDMVLFSVSVMFVIYLFSLKVKHVPKFLDFISRYSFGIYLLHMFAMSVLSIILNNILKGDVGWISIPILFLFSLLGSIVIVYLLDKFKYGYLMVGKLGISYFHKPVSAVKKLNIHLNKNV